MATASVLSQIEFHKHTITYQSHFHNAYEMIYVLDGKARMRIGNASYNVGADSLVFINNLEEHSVTILEQPYVRYFLTIAPAIADQLIMDSRLLSVFKNRPGEYNHIFDIRKISPTIKQHFRSLLHEHDNADEFSREIIGGLLRQILIHVYRYNSEQFPIPTKSIKSQIYEIQRHIDLHFAEPLNIQAIAQQFYISPSYLSHSFKELTGYSPKQYIMLHRLIHAKELLVNSDVTTSEIAYRSGFTNINNFIKHFKAQYRTTPGRLRAQWRRNIR